MVKQKIVINAATDNGFHKITSYYVTIAIQLPQQYHYVH